MLGYTKEAASEIVGKLAKLAMKLGKLAFELKSD